ncbi:DUF3800 domain-containing protein [Devosia rhodophyticola]|uniref:DUF3800 domain-containing protein n=1 Tax=Devosia rhodophyticola TaxID=3026423 RepID=A0ABY7YWF4_9HYPH|nr:DUF3800 domain-containing protein [Devosia rhodophyticola]WDR05566.1 DUF3800 domain-containing protein [Devosia rhodophyticola]
MSGTEPDYEEIDTDLPEYEYVLYVDEAGDIGTRTATEGDQGSTEWLVLGGIVIAKKYEPEVPQWISEIRRTLGATQGPELHYKKLNRRKRIEVATQIAGLKTRAFVVASHKSNMRGHKNPRAQRIPGENTFYNFCLRILLERASVTVLRSSLKEFGSPKRMKVILARTGGIRYSQTRAYIEVLRLQAFNNATFLSKRVIEPTVVSWKLIGPVSAKTSSGCQIADCVASSFYNGLNELGGYPRMTDAAIALDPIMARENGLTRGFGLQLLPWDKNIPETYRSLFEHYGYRWSRKL